MCIDREHNISVDRLENTWIRSCCRSVNRVQGYRDMVYSTIFIAYVIVGSIIGILEHMQVN